MNHAPGHRTRRHRWARWLRRKDWDDHVGHIEEVAQGDGFMLLRDRILELAELEPGAIVVDVGAGTGLLALAAAPAAGRVWAIDISAAMCRRLQAKLRERGIANVEVRRASATQLPLPDAAADVVVSNYCYHHLNDRDKDKALLEAKRVLRPGGRLVIGDMMFRVRVSDARDRAVLLRLVGAMLRRGPAGLLRILKNALRYLSGRWEHPADVEWWREALDRAGFESVELEPLEHEGGIAAARRPAPTQRPAGLAAAG